MALFCALCLTTLRAAPDDADSGTLAMSRPLAVRAVTADRTELPAYERVTLTVDLTATYRNPYDSDQICVDATVQPSEGDAWHVPGFLYQECARTLVDNVEHIEASGTPGWRVRLSFKKPGQYSVTVVATDQSGSVTSEPLSLTATAANAPGMVRRHPRDHRYLVTDRGETLFLSGANVCWGDRRGTFSYDEWLPQYAKAGCNFFRVWLSPGWTTFAMNSADAGYDEIDLGSAWRLDHVLESAEQLDLRVLLCVDSFNILRSNKRGFGQWEDSYYVKTNGGPLDNPREYFTDTKMLKAYRDRLRYLVARYGYSPNVFAWEFWNEVDIIDDYDSDAVTAWHRDMARYLRSVDPWNHLIGTSHAGPAGDPQLDVIPELDFVQTHHYSATDMARDLHNDRLLKAAAQDRPHFHGEFGICHDGQRTAEMDPQAVHFRNALYASAGQLQAGTPMTWWWDTYVHPYDLYTVLGAFNRWIEGYDFVAQESQPVRATILLPEGRLPRAPDDDILQPEKASWHPAPFNRPVTVRIDRYGDVANELPLSRVMHGLRNHAELHNPVTFELDAPCDTTFGVIVEGVSGHGGAKLEISLDDAIVREEDFADTDNKTDTLTKYDGVYDIPLPAGRH
ncbi:MAG: cellulase family glycosylhydrolase, partial [bacterium]|nr:cellulase family glycosylhydrolase [bacterium]